MIDACFSAVCDPLSGAVGSVAGLLVTFPNCETRKLAPGPSSVISKAVIETFTKRFLETPAILWLSESGNKIVARDDQVANAIGLRIEPDKNLPDLILADIGPAEPLIVFVEVVATDGAITARRQVFGTGGSVRLVFQSLLVSSD